MVKDMPNCEYLRNDRFCRALNKNEEGKVVREESCTNAFKNSCCYLCAERDTCAISCHYLDKIAVPDFSLSDKVSASKPSPVQECRRCGTMNRPGSKFCKKCGAAMQPLERCPQCGNELESDAAYCQECGQEVTKQKPAAPLRVTPRRLTFGLEFLIALGALGALFYFGSSIMAFWAASTIFQQSNEISQTLETAGAVWMLVALFQITVSWGLWELQNWARKAMVLVAILDIVGTFLNPIYGILGFVFSIIVLAYLYTSHVDALFSSRSRARALRDAAYPHSCGGCKLFRSTALCPRKETNPHAETCTYYRAPSRKVKG